MGTKLILSALALFTGSMAFSQDIYINDKDTGILYRNMPQIELIAHKNDQLFRKTPGSVSVIKNKQINIISPLSGNDIMKKIPGLNVVDEEGAGLRINIGIRGLDPDRSRNILILEDGIPVALNPYGEPEMYFTPPIDKMKEVEVLKGSGQLLYGPQTIGGVVNFLTANPPSTEKAEFKLRGGQGGFFSGYASYGNTAGNTGFLVSYLHKRADNMGPTWFSLHDLSAKMRIRLSERSNIGVKLGVYDELSNSTYVGITQIMYNRGGEDFVRIAPDDRLPVRRYNASITHQFEISNTLKLQTTAFAYTTTRNWQRQEFTTNSSAANQTGVVWGDPSVSNGALYMLNTNGHRNRQFQVAGIEPKLTIEHPLFDQENKLQVGFRLLTEKADEQFVIGNKADAAAGNMRDNEIRKGFALSAYAQNEIKMGERWSASFGFRIENFDYSRRILRGRFNINNVNNVVADTNLLTRSNIFAFIPGAGINFKANDMVSIFAGVHKGFAPPRTKDAITSSGMALDIESENSMNYELGGRLAVGKILTAEATLFYMDFKNQVIPVSQSSGNANATGLANGGRTEHKGIELGAEADIAKAFGSKHAVIIGATFTAVDSRFSADRFLSKDGNSFNVKDNKLPYAPEFLINTSIGYESPKGFGIRFFGNYVSEQFTDELNTVDPNNLGLIGKIESRFIADGTAYYNVPGDKFSFNLSAKNIFDERYMVSRRPQGIKVGLPRFITAGIDIRL